MKKRLSVWWEQTSSRGYIAKRRLVEPAWQEQVVPLEQLIVYYCGRNFTPKSVSSQEVPPTFVYLINGEKEPPNAPEDSPWARERTHFVGGVLRTDELEIIPILYLAVYFSGQKGSKTVREYTSDQVPLVQNKSRTVRVVAGQFENAIHPVMADVPITLLDVVLNQGGEFSWQIPQGYKSLVYVMSGVVHFGTKNVLQNCVADTLVTVKGKSLYATAQCAGGRFLVIATRQEGARLSTQEAYEKVALHNLEQVETKN